MGCSVRFRKSASEMLAPYLYFAMHQLVLPPWSAPDISMVESDFRLD